MPAESKAQQRFMAGCEHNPKHMEGKCPSKKVASEFSSTDTSGLPEHKKPAHDKPLKKSMMGQRPGRRY